MWIPLDFLSRFNSLTHLEIYNLRQGGMTTHTLQSIFTACPNLTHFKLVHAHSDLPTSNITSSDSMPPNLKVLDLSTLWISVGQLINYVTASGLDEFKLYASGDVFDVWVQDCDKNELADLADKLRSTHHSNINMMALPPWTTSRGPQLPSVMEAISSDQKMDTFVSFIPSLCKGRKMVCELHLDIYKSPEPVLHPV